MCYELLLDVFLYESLWIRIIWNYYSPNGVVFDVIATVIAANKLVIDVYINPYNTAETLVITIINTNTSEAYTG